MNIQLFIMKQLQKNVFQKFSLPRQGKVLDLGCGSKPRKGYFSTAFYIGLDSCLEANPEVCAKSETVPFKNASFDTVLCMELLEHCASPGETLKEIKRVLKQGGALYLSVPQSWPLHYEPEDYWRFTPYGMERLLGQAGLRLIKKEKIGGIFSLLSQHMIDAAWVITARYAGFLGRRNAERLASLLWAPASLILYSLSWLVDPLDKRFALGWALLVAND